jgi:hypothetical protein
MLRLNVTGRRLWAEQEAKNAALRNIDYSHFPPLRLADLVGDEGSITLTDEVTVPASVISKACRGGRWETSMSEPGGVRGLLARSGLAEDRLAKRLKIARERLAETCWRLWQRSFTEERDRRAGRDANAQRRGQVARILQAELERQLDGDR